MYIDKLDRLFIRTNNKVNSKQERKNCSTHRRVPLKRVVIASA